MVLLQLGAPRTNQPVFSPTPSHAGFTNHGTVRWIWWNHSCGGSEHRSPRICRQPPRRGWWMCRWIMKFDQLPLEVILWVFGMVLGFFMHIKRWDDHPQYKEFRPWHIWRFEEIWFVTCFFWYACENTSCVFVVCYKVFRIFKSKSIVIHLYVFVCLRYIYNVYIYILYMFKGYLGVPLTVSVYQWYLWCSLGILGIITYKYTLYRAYIGISHKGTLVGVHPTMPWYVSLLSCIPWEWTLGYCIPIFNSHHPGWHDISRGSFTFIFSPGTPNNQLKKRNMTGETPIFHLKIGFIIQLFKPTMEKWVV